MGNRRPHPSTVDAAAYAVCICPVVRLGAMVIHRKGQLCRTSYAVCIILVRRGPVGVSLRPVSVIDLPTIERWAGVMADHMSRTRPYAEAADRHDPDSGLYWYVIAEDDHDVGTVWIELLPAGSEAVLGVFLGDASCFGRGIGTAAIDLAIAEFRRVHRHVPIVLRVRRSNARAIACYRRVGFTVAGGGSKSLPSGEAVPYYRMVCLPC